LNRILSLTIDFQNTVFDKFSDRMDEIIQAHAEAGTLDVGIETITGESLDKVSDEVVATDERTGADTRYVQVDVSHKNKTLPFENAISRVNHQAFVRNVRSGKIWSASGRRQRTDKAGNVVWSRSLVSPSKNSQRVDDIDLQDPDKWERLGDDQAERLWNEQLDQLPGIVKERRHIFTGSLLNVWNRLATGGRPKVLRLTTSDGEKILGREVNDSAIDQVLDIFGAGERERIQLAGGEAMGRVLDQEETIRLDNGWRIKKVRVSGESRIEIKGPGFNDLRWLEGMGVFTEMVNWDNRYFIPVPEPGAEYSSSSGAKMLENIMATHPIARVEGRYVGPSLVDKIRDETGSTALFSDMVNLAADLIGQGFDTVKKFRAEARRLLGDAWQKVKDIAGKAFLQAKKATKAAAKPLTNERGEVTIKQGTAAKPKPRRKSFKEMFTSEEGLPSNATIKDTSGRISKIGRQIRPPHWLAAKYPAFNKLYTRQKERIKERLTLLHESLKEIEAFTDLKRGPVLDEVRDIIWGVEKVGAVKDLSSKFKEEGGSLSQNEDHYTGLRQWLRRRKRKFSDEAIDNYIGIRRTLDKDLLKVYDSMRSMDDIDESVIKQFRKSINHIHNYFPHMRYGRYYLTVKDEKTGETLYREHFDAAPGFFKRKAREKLTEFAKRFPGMKVEAGKVERMPEEVFAIPVPIEALEAVMNEAVKRIADPEAQKAFQQALPKAVADALKARGWGSHMINRKNIPGFETQDVQRVLLDYKSGLYGWITKMQAARDFSKIIGKVDASADPELWSGMKSYTADMLANSDEVDRAVDFARSIFFAKFLGANIKTAVLNTTQNLVAGVPRLGMEIDGSATEWVGAAGNAITGMFTQNQNLSETEQQLLKDLYDNGNLQSNFLAEVRGKVGSNPRSRWDKMVSWMGKPMEYAERFNRASLALAAFRAASSGAIKNEKTLNKLGLEKGQKADFEQAKTFAERIVDDSHFVFGKHNRPEIFRGKTGKVASLAYTFRSFSHNMWELWAYMWRNGDEGKKAIAKSIGAMVAIGGIGSIPVYHTFMNIMRQLTGEDWSERALHAALGENHGTLRDIILYGAPSLAGVDLGGSIGMEVPILENANLSDSVTGQISGGIGEIVGVPWAITEEMEKQIGFAMDGNSLRALEHGLTPTAAANILKAIRLYKEGSTTKSGRPIALPGDDEAYRLSLGGAIKKGLGFQDVGLSKGWDIHSSVTDRAAYRKRQQDRFVQEIRKAQQSKDPGRIREAWKKVDRWNREQRANKKPEYVISKTNINKSLAALRRPRQPSKAMRPKAYELRQDYF
jgi:hypothetical protein